MNFKIPKANSLPTVPDFLFLETLTITSRLLLLFPHRKIWRTKKLLKNGTWVEVSSAATSSPPPGSKRWWLIRPPPWRHHRCSSPDTLCTSPWLLEHIKQVPASLPLHLLFPPPRILFPICSSPSLANVTISVMPPRPIELKMVAPYPCPRDFISSWGNLLPALIYYMFYWPALLIVCPSFTSLEGTEFCPFCSC